MALRSFYTSTKPTAKYYAFCVAFSSAVIGYFTLRLSEVISMILFSPLHAVMVLTVLGGLVSLFVFPPKITSAVVRRAGLIVLVLLSMRQEMDPSIVKLAGHRDISGSVCIVTGANSGIGLATSQLLAMRGADVIMACRSLPKCFAAQAQMKTILENQRKNIEKTLASTPPQNLTGPVILPGKLHVMRLDLADLRSVRSFVNEVSARFPKVDVLVNNAGFIAAPGQRTAQGLESSFGVMHVGHFALTQWLMPLLLKSDEDSTANTAAAGTATTAGAGEASSSEKKTDPSGADSATAGTGALGRHFAYTARVVTVGSQFYLAGSFHPSLMESSPASDGVSSDLRGEVTDNCPHLWGVVPCCPSLPCPLTNGYARAQLANMLHMHELQHRSDAAALEASKAGQTVPRRLVTSYVNPGTVQTGLRTWMSSSWMDYVLRSPVEASMLVLRAIESDSYAPSSYQDPMGHNHDLQDYRSRLMSTHIEAFPAVLQQRLPFTRKRVFEFYSMDEALFKRMSLVSTGSLGFGLIPSGILGSIGSTNKNFTHPEVAARLFDTTQKIVDDWEEHD